MFGINLDIEPDLVYLVGGGAVIPSKALEYKTDPATGTVETIPPHTREFEAQLKLDIGKLLTEQKIFPTKEEVMVVITHGYISQKKYGQCDLDNKAKLILDALKGPVYLDDSQVKILFTNKEKNDSENYYRISVKILSNSISKSIADSIDKYNSE